MGWSDNLNRLTTKGGHNLGELMQAVKIELFSGIVDDTRVDTGRLKGNWQIQENTAANGVLSANDPSGSITKSKIASAATKSGLTYLTNNLPYAQAYEEKDAMVRRNILRVMQNISSMAKKITG